MRAITFSSSLAASSSVSSVIKVSWTQSARLSITASFMSSASARSMKACASATVGVAAKAAKRAAQ